MTLLYRGHPLPFGGPVHHIENVGGDPGRARVACRPEQTWATNSPHLIREQDRVLAVTCEACLAAIAASRVVPDEPITVLSQEVTDMTPRQAVNKLRKYLRQRGDHHPNCASRLARCEADPKECDCYARDREEAHAALDVLEATCCTRK